MYLSLGAGLDTALLRSHFAQCGEVHYTAEDHAFIMVFWAPFIAGALTEVLFDSDKKFDLDICT